MCLKDLKTNTILLGRKTVLDSSCGPWQNSCKGTKCSPLLSHTYIRTCEGTRVMSAQLYGTILEHSASEALK